MKFNFTFQVCENSCDGDDEYFSDDTCCITSCITSVILSGFIFQSLLLLTSLSLTYLRQDPLLVSEGGISIQASFCQSFLL